MKKQETVQLAVHTYWSYDNENKESNESNKVRCSLASGEQCCYMYLHLHSLPVCPTTRKETLLTAILLILMYFFDTCFFSRRFVIKHSKKFLLVHMMGTISLSIVSPQIEKRRDSIHLLYNKSYMCWGALTLCCYVVYLMFLWPSHAPYKSIRCLQSLWFKLYQFFMLGNGRSCWCFHISCILESNLWCRKFGEIWPRNSKIGRNYLTKTHFSKISQNFLSKKSENSLQKKKRCSKVLCFVFEHTHILTQKIHLWADGVFHWLITWRPSTIWIKKPLLFYIGKGCSHGSPLIFMPTPMLELPPSRLWASN